MSILKIIVKIFLKLIDFINLEYIKISHYKCKASNIMSKVFVRLEININSKNI